jgi:hypothetical protein
MGDVQPQKVKRVTKKAKAPTPVVETTVPVVSSETLVDSSSVKTTDEAVPTPASSSVPVPPKEKEIRLTEIPVVDEITALNLMVSFLGLAQKRGAYTIDEASKIWECIKKFQRPG